MEVNHQEKRSETASFSSGHRWRIRLNLWISIVSLVAVVGLLNYISSGWYRRFAWGPSKVVLSQQTLELLKSTTNRIEVTIFFDKSSDEDLYALVLETLQEYSYANPNIVVQPLDYTRLNATAQLLVSKYKLAERLHDKNKNFIIFACNDRTRVIFANELSKYDLDNLLSGQSKEIRRGEFSGEVLFSSAIYSVTHPHPVKAYFLFGQGEHNPEIVGTQGYAKFAAILKEEDNIEWKRLSLQGTNEIPADCQLLIIAGPGESRFNDFELATIDRYAHGGGRLLILLNYTGWGGMSGIETMLEKWGVSTSKATVEDEPSQLTGPGDLRAELNAKGNHPVIDRLVADDLPLRLIQPHPVGTNHFSKSPQAPKVDILASTSASGSDGIQHGRVPLMVAVEQGAIKGIANEHGASRMIVVGDSYFLDNEIIESGANSAFARRAVDWLMDRPQARLSGLGPRPVQQYKILIPAGEFRQIEWIFLAGMPGAVLFVGAMVWLRRRI